jgi:uncharacterized protein (DUF1499 family)
VTWCSGWLALVAGACAANKPATLGVVDGKLAPCPAAPHCVTSQQEGGIHSIAPIHYTMSRDDARRRLVSIIRAMPGADLITDSNDYVRAEFTTPRFKFVDDVEIYLDDRDKLAHFRSSSRTGFWDLGANRRRIEEIRRQFVAEKKEPAGRRAPKKTAAEG